MITSKELETLWDACMTLERWRATMWCLGLVGAVTIFHMIATGRRN